MNENTPEIDEEIDNATKYAKWAEQYKNENPMLADIFNILAEITSKH